jgi:RsiW-degrading membrane proteinase PrsW (M82 family)
MESLLLAVGALAPVAILVGLCVSQLRSLQPPASARAIVLFFALGLLSVVVAILFALPLDLFTVGFAGRPTLFGVYDAFMVAALPEELARFCVMRWPMGRLRSVLTSQRSLLLGALVGLGFAALENTAYCVWGGWSAVWGRALTSVPLHALSSAVIGYAIGYSLDKRQVFWAILGVAVTTVLHGINNFNFKLWYSGSSPETDIALPTEGLGALLITGWPSNIAIVLLLLAAVVWLARRPFPSIDPLSGTGSIPLRETGSSTIAS